MYVCMYHTYVSMYIYIYIHTYIYRYTYICAHIYISGETVEDAARTLYVYIYIYKPERETLQGMIERSRRPVTTTGSSLGSGCVSILNQHTSAYVNIHQHTPAYACHYHRQFARQRMRVDSESAYVSIRQHTPAYASIRLSLPQAVR